jgi:4-amino-4-deoxy-L-arabinose transferase-like glycosyltransferase
MFGVVAPCFIYLFTREEFGGSRAALLVAAVYALYPVAIRTSVTVRSETIFVVFVLASMWLLAIARSDLGRPIHAASAGLALTLAAMLRFEGWMLIPFRGVLLWRKPKFMILFGAIAMIHPAIGMIGNWMEFGDPLYSTNWTSNFVRYAMGRADQPFDSLAASAIRYPYLTLRGMNLLVGLVAAAGALSALVTRDRARVWLVPLVGVSTLLMISIAHGSLGPKLPYTLTLGTMLLPFGAVVFRRLGVESLGAQGDS